MSVTMPATAKSGKSEPVRPQRYSPVSDAAADARMVQAAEEEARLNQCSVISFADNDLISGRPGTSSGHSKMRGVRAVNTPVAPIHVDRRYFPRDMRGLLEIYEQGSTLQQGMKSHCQETTDAFEILANQCEDTVKVLMSSMEDILGQIQRQVDRPANVDWTLVKTWLHKIDGLQPAAIGKDVEQRLSMHQDYMNDWEQRLEEKIVSKIQGMDDALDRREESQRQELLKLRGEVKSAQQLATQIGEGVKQSETLLSESFINQHQALKTDFAAAVQDILRVQEKNRRADMAKVEPALEQQLARMLSQHHQNLQASVAKNIEDILQVQQEQKVQIADIEPLVKTHLANQFENAKNENEEYNIHIKDIHHTVHEDVGHLFNEIAVIQRAMHLDHVCITREVQGAFAGDGTRCREFMTQTEPPSVKEANSQTDEAYFRQLKKKEDKRKKLAETKGKGLPVVAQQAPPLALKQDSGWADQEKKKAKMREALIKPSYSVTTYYSTTGWAQAIARSDCFENLTFLVIMCNAVWIAVDTDYNDAVLLINAQNLFIAMENVFCTYFTIELIIRFLAFRRKKNCFKDFWFGFDLLLLGGMIAETWVITGIFLLMSTGGAGAADGAGSFSILRMARLIKIVRMARMARLLRMVPELVVILKSIGAAFRSVSFFLMLTVIILYVYAVAMRQMTKETEIGPKYFRTVPEAMNNLLLDGMLPLYAPIVKDISNENFLFWPVVMSFILLASITVMNMLVGVLVEVVRTVADTEREAMTVVHVTNELRKVMNHFIEEGCESGSSSAFFKTFQNTKSASRATLSNAVAHEIPDMSRDCFEDFLTSKGVISLLSDCGVDAVALMEGADMIFEEKVKTGQTGVSFVDFVEIVLNMRGTNPATVKDVKEQIRILTMRSKENAVISEAKMTKLVLKVRNDIMLTLNELRRIVDSDCGSAEGGMVTDWTAHHDDDDLHSHHDHDHDHSHHDDHSHHSGCAPNDDDPEAPLMTRVTFAGFKDEVSDSELID